MALTKVPNELSSTPSIVDGGNGTAITIDSSENVLIGQTSPSGSATGMYFRPGQESGINSDGDSALQLKRLTNDGAVLRFYQGGTNVGSIDSRIGQGITINSSSGADGILSNGGSYSYGWNAAYFYPRVDATSDLGFSGGLRFKDLYLSGGAYLGGTAAANKLDLYETGTFTPVLKGSTATGSFTAGSGTTAKYVAIGDTVTISIALRNCTLSGASGDIYIDGCPFSLNSGVNYPIGGFMSHNLSFDTAHHQSFYGQSDNIFGMQSRTGTSWIGWPVTNSSGIYLHITMVCTKV